MERATIAEGYESASAYLPNTEKARAPPGGDGARDGRQDQELSLELEAIAIVIVAVRHSTTGPLRAMQLR
jgi:hypothetical protein